MARLRAYPRKRASRLPDPNGGTPNPSKVEVPHLSLDDFRLPAPPGWTASPVRVDELPDDPPTPQAGKVESP